MEYCSMPGCPRGTGGCPLCGAGSLPSYLPGIPLPPRPLYHLLTPWPVGCVCPPTAEKTCESGICPRKNHLKSAGAPIGA